MKRVTLVFVTASLTTGCASIVNGTNQVISVETRYQGSQVVGASCELVNPKGTYFVTTPGTVTINRAYDNLSVKCEKEGMHPGLATAISITKPMAFGNILLGGIVGAAVDAGSGAAYDYPSLIRVNMGGLIAPPTPVAAEKPSTAEKPILKTLTGPFVQW
jgi:uncharacterized protein YceK